MLRFHITKINKSVFTNNINIKSFISKNFILFDLTKVVHTIKSTNFLIFKRHLTFCTKIMDPEKEKNNEEIKNNVLNEVDKKKEKKLAKLAEKEKKLAKKAEREQLKNEATKVIEYISEDINKDNYGYINVKKIKEVMPNIELHNLEEIYNVLLKIDQEIVGDGINVKREDVGAENIGTKNIGAKDVEINESNAQNGITTCFKDTLSYNIKEQKNIWVRGRIHDIRCKGSLAFIVLRYKIYTLQCILDIKNINNDKNMIKWLNHITLESIVDIYGKLIKPSIPIESTNIKYEIHVNKLFCISKTSKDLPFLLKDANMKETSQEGSIKVNQDNRLNNRCIDLRTHANYSIFVLQSEICNIFREYLNKYNFIEIHTPKLLGESSEGGATAFKLNYFDKNGYLAQSPQLYKQMCINAGFDRVYEVAPVFRAENSNTYRHLCEYVSLDIEMTYKYDYMENVYFYDSMFQYIFTQLSTLQKNKMLINIIKEQYPSDDFVWIEKTPIFTYEEAIKMLIKNNKLNLDEKDIFTYDMSTDMEKELGKIVKNLYKTDYYIIINFPSSLRPFYTMYDEKNKKISHSYDFFMRGEEILSGAQRISDVNILIDNIKRFNLDVNKLNFYIDSFAYSSFPHSGCGIGLERVLMLFLGLNNIRKTSLFPRDPKRLTP
ncbi:aspartate--tRNA ligase [Hepatocystis sp. ex Piliocolobus tephrosceles]|uniref:Aspartate--tRNA ligase, cytoplasmic n=1 Tax=Piliocolobus tephrosceles TaxID=591936 RepID=A0A8C9HRS0_9PRIM|nr:aspartate--tRNA ligase [Hepatocystis sp. ex Piliocolobus tephrosceles]VWU51323.1 aspartate--tRNA ligase [Hepatocystis sp. ex Piliocolobus tephrosceles]